jgi:hypothetical protein
MFSAKPTRIDYCQYLLVSQVNFTLTHLAEHHERFSHDAMNRYLRGDKLTSRMIWENVRAQVVTSALGYLVFDDSVLDKDHSHKIELVRRQYSGNAHGLIKGIGVVNCLYVNPESGQYWIVDYRIFDPDGDGKTKLDHVREMLISAVADKQLPFKAVLMDTWYATKALMLLIESLHKLYVCPIKDNRLVDDSGECQRYRRVDKLDWSEQEQLKGKLIKINGFPKDHRVKLFRLVVSTHRTDWIVTNDLAQDSLDATQQACGMRWKIEQYHRELKQLTGVEKCQCRKARIQRNHIACAMLVWIRLMQVARQTGQTIYRLKHGLFSNYLRQELRQPSITMGFV